MKGSDITIMIYKLGILNNYLEEDKKESEKDIKYWEEQIKEFGEDTPIVSSTYGETLEITKEFLNDTLKEIEENNKLIESLKDESKIIVNSR